MTPLSDIRARCVRWALSLTLAAMTLPAAPPPSTGVSPLIEAFRAAVAEAEQMPDPFGSGLDVLAGARLVDMAKVDFIVSFARPISTRYVHERDRDLVLSAVLGQSPDELETHLPALTNYVRLATASRIYYGRIRRQELLFGRQRGLATLAKVARRAEDFRTSHLALIRSGRIRPSRVLTTANLGELGDPSLVAAVDAAYRDGRNQFLNQRNSIVWLVFLIQLGISYGVAVLFLQKRKPELRIGLSR